MKIRSKILLLVLLPALLWATGSGAQVRMLPDMEAEKLISPESLRRDVEFLSDSLCQGRGAAQRGRTEAAFWVGRQFAATGLLPFGGSFCQPFTAEGHRCHNIAGMLPSGNGSGRYIIVMAHYDNLGTLNGKLYPGADSNASGVVTLKDLARMLSFFRSNGGYLPQNVIFVALDGKQLSMAGSRELWSAISLGKLRDPLNGKAIRARDISMVVNLDILGGTASPLSRERVDYIIMLGGGRYNGVLQSANIHNSINLEIGLDYYGSPSFTDLFLRRVSDQKPFLDHGIYSVMFTSGISLDTNRDTDTPDKLDYLVFERRVKLIFHWIERMANKKK